MTLPFSLLLERNCAAARSSDSQGKYLLFLKSCTAIFLDIAKAQSNRVQISKAGSISLNPRNAECSPARPRSCQLKRWINISRHQGPKRRLQHTTPLPETWMPYDGNSDKVSPMPSMPCSHTKKYGA